MDEQVAIACKTLSDNKVPVNQNYATKFSLNNATHPFSMGFIEAWVEMKFL